VKEREPWVERSVRSEMLPLESVTVSFHTFSIGIHEREYGTYRITC
jgi:hypothetical protein